MRIKDLDPAIRKKAVEYTRIDFPESPITEEYISDWDLIECFYFHKTEEGSDYWFDIYES